MVKYRKTRILSKDSDEIARANCQNLRMQGYSLSQIAKQLGKARSWVQKWVKRLRHTDDITRQKGHRNPTKVTKQIKQKVKRMLRNPKIGSIRSTKARLGQQGIDLGTTTIGLIAKDLDLVYRVKPPKPFLELHHKQLRVAFCKEILTSKPSNWHKRLLFTDESYFSCFTSTRGVWVSRDDPVPTNPHVHHPRKLMVSGFVSWNGKSSLKIYQEKETMDSDKYEDYIRQQVIPSARRLYPDKPKWILVQDNASCHRSREMKTCFADHDIEYILNWPAYSPDLNVIENIWSIMKYEMAKTGPQTLQDLKRAIKRSWHNISLECIRNLIGNWKERLQQVIRSKGEPIDY